MNRTAWDWFIGGLTLTNSAILAFIVLAGSQPAPVNPPGPPPPAVDTVSVGHSYGVTLSKTYASAWRKAADEVDAGKTITEAQADMQTSWASARSAEGTRLVTPIFAAIIPEESEGDATTRPKWSKAARDLATGLESVK